MYKPLKKPAGWLRERNKRVKWYTYEEARDICRALVKEHNIPSPNRWYKFIQTYELPKKLPHKPRYVYEEEFTTIYDFLGLERRKYLSHEDAKLYIQDRDIKTEAQYKEWYRKYKPSFMPGSPNGVYDTSWGDFLGTGNTVKKEWRSYKEAIKYVHGLNLKSTKERDEWNRTKRPNDIPSNPDRVYKDEWEGRTIWYGTNLVSRLEVKNIDITVLYILQEPETPSNIYTIGLYSDGITSFNKWKHTKEFKVIKLYNFEHGKNIIFDLVMNQLCSEWWDSFTDNQFVISNIFEVIQEFETLFEEVKQNNK